MSVRSLRILLALVVSLLFANAVFAQNLEIHYINVGWGSSVFVKGPNGTTVLMEAGNTGKGTAKVVPYLQSIGILPATGLDYTIIGHQHCDHVGGMDEVINAGYNVRIKNYYNGSSYASSCVDQWNAAAATTTAGPPAVPAAGAQIPLGNGAMLTIAAVNGSIIGGGSVAVSDENDRSIAVLIQYGGFDYLWASDMGGGNIDNACTGRFTSSQTDVETSVINAISPGGVAPKISAGGIDVLNVNHHGSESSTNINWMNKSVPAVAIIATGDGQSAGWDLPRIDVVEHVLLAQATACVTAPAALVLQTEEGAPTGTLTSFAGYSVGNIKVTTDGSTGFTVSADGQVTQGANELVASGLPRTFALDDGPPAPDTTAPVTSITSPANGATVSGSVSVTATASDNVGVTRVEFWLDGVLQSTDTTSPYSWSWNTTTAANGSHLLHSEAFDAAGNRGVSADVSVTVNNDLTAPTTSITAPAGGATVSGTTPVSASASDNVGVTKVEFYLDAVLQSTDTASPYDWSWITTSTPNGSHSLTSKAYDAAGNIGTSAAVSVTVNNTGLDISNWKVVQANASNTFFLPAGTVIPDNGYVVIARNATKAAFETFWHVTLPANAIYINSGGVLPVINGQENYTLYNAAGAKVEGPTVSMAQSGGNSMQRKDPCLAPGVSSSWNVLAAGSATPGSGAGAGCAKGVVINEFSDALGTGNFIYEFVELHLDR
jgi:beta-lactamase superfamily II metal-dependent hydrolase